jgi:hypothetical protein
MLLAHFSVIVSAHVTRWVSAMMGAVLTPVCCLQWWGGIRLVEVRCWELYSPKSCMFCDNLGNVLQGISEHSECGHDSCEKEVVIV